MLSKKLKMPGPDSLNRKTNITGLKTENKLASAQIFSAWFTWKLGILKRRLLFKTK